MSIIQKIQEKYAKLMAIIIALALIIFVVMLAFENGGTLFQTGNSNVVGKVNGQKITLEAFDQKVDQQENFMKTQGYGSGPASRYQAVEATWGQEVNRLLIQTELDKLGIEVTKREMGDLLYGANPPQDLKQQFTDSTGQFNAALAKQQIDNVLKNGTPEQKIQLNTYFNQLEFMRLNEKYNSLLSNSTNFPKWLVEKQNAENSQLSRISYVREFYTSIPDSTVKVTDKEIEDYINAHKNEFKQREEIRSIDYVMFSALPTAADSAAARNKLLDLKAEFDSTNSSNVQQFLEIQGVQNYYDGYINGNRIQIAAKDSFLKLPVNSVYGPYLDGGSYAMAKIIGVRTQPDTVSFRHILVGLNKTDPQTGQQYPVRDSAAAYKLADSLMKAIAAGTPFDSLVVKFSDDLGSNTKGGKYEEKERQVSGVMVGPFNDFNFGNPVGTKGLVNTQFGTHYIEILSQKGSSPAYKVAYLTQPIEVSNETDADARNRANLFAGQSTDQKSFNANVEKLKSQGINKMVESNITENAYQLQVGISRSLVKSIFDADLGDVVEPEKVGDNYVVAIVTGITKKGTQPASIARMVVEPILRNRKKADIIAKKLNNATTLEAAAAAWGGKAIEVADSLRLDGASMSPIASTEPKVLGAAFNPANKGKVTPPIYGQSGVYVVRVEDITATPVGDANVSEKRKALYQQSKNNVFPQTALREAATVKDSRSKFY
jgi:peptidyl-prolyl cis-trans isomerase D